MAEYVLSFAALAVILPILGICAVFVVARNEVAS